MLHDLFFAMNVMTTVNMMVLVVVVVVMVVMMKTTTMLRLKRWTEGAPENEIVRLCERMRIQ